jgi:hypothetical protein
MYFLAREREQHDSAIMRGKLTMAAHIGRHTQQRDKNNG